MKQFVVLALAVLSTAACGHSGSSTTLPASAPSAPVCSGASVDSVLAEENSFRDSQGLTALTQGLSCTLYTVPANTPNIASATLTKVLAFNYHGVFNQPNTPVSDGLNILPSNIQSQYTAWFVVKCTGDVVVVDGNTYGFSLASDDGAILKIDGVSVVNNDGNHSVTTAVGTRALRQGVHSFELDYMQGPAGYQALILQSNGSIIPSEVFAH